jgi:hypothetical protein
MRRNLLSILTLSVLFASCNLPVIIFTESSQEGKGMLLFFAAIIIIAAILIGRGRANYNKQKEKDDQWRKYL